MKLSITGAGFALAAACALAACSSGNADADGDGKITQDEAQTAMSSVRINPGQWENTVEFVNIEFDESKLPPEAKEFIGPMLESMKGQVNTSKSCVTEEEADKPSANMFSGNEDADCTYDRFTFANGTMDMAMTCNDPNSGTAKITNTGSYTPDGYDMQMKVELEDDQIGAMTISAAAKGKRIGDCPAE
jgi:hypothetical protein